MAENDDIKEAMAMLIQGAEQKAIAKLLALESQTTNKRLRLKIIDLLLSSLDPIDKTTKLIALSDEGAKIADNYGAKNLQAHFMSRKAAFLLTQVSFLQYRQQNLKLSPKWFQFSIEADKEEYEKLTNNIQETEAEIEYLLKKALILAEESGNNKVLGRILMENGSILTTRYLHLKSEYLRGRLQTKLWLAFDVFKHPFFEGLFIFSRKHAKQLKTLIKTFTKYFIDAAKIFEALNDPTEGYAYHNLANSLKSAYLFKKARVYWKKAKTVAEKYDDQILKRKTDDLEKEISARNKNIPDYVNGERRKQ